MIHARAHLRLAVNGVRWWLLVAAQRHLDRARYRWQVKNQGRTQ